MKKIIFSKEDVKILEKVLTEAYFQRSNPLSTNDEKAECEPLRTMVKKLGEAIRIAQENGLVKGFKKFKEDGK